MLSMIRLFFACAAGASALQVQDPTRVLLFGASLDRNAIEDFCGEDLKSSDFLQTRCCEKPTYNTRVAFIFHPGVGYNGNLNKPFHHTYVGHKFHSGSFSTGAILTKYAQNMSSFMLGGSPDLVVVDTSLWDLAVWRQEDKAEVSTKRVRQWCQHDLPFLLEVVKVRFPTSRIAFRTAPTIDQLGPSHLLEKFTEHEIDMLYDCVTSSTVDGKLRLPRPLQGGSDEYEVIDYHAIMNKLIDHRGTRTGLFMGDGYHPTSYPSTLYINEVLRRVGKNPQDPPEPPHAEISERRARSELLAEDQFGPF
jgi:hypothetical protein